MSVYVIIKVVIELVFILLTTFVCSMYLVFVYAGLNRVEKRGPVRLVFDYC